MAETIHIKAEEIQEWLVLRRKLDKNWFMKYTSLLKIQEKTLAEIRLEVSSPKVQEFLSEKTELMFPDLLQLKELLINSEEGQKRNFFNQYSSKHITNLSRVLKMYQSNFYDVGSLSKRLNEILSYELVACKKAVEDNTEQCKEFDYKIKQAHSAIGQLRKEILKVIHQYNPGFTPPGEVENFSFERFIRDFVYLLPQKMGLITD